MCEHLAHLVTTNPYFYISSPFFLLFFLEIPLWVEERVDVVIH